MKPSLLLLFKVLILGKILSAGLNDLAGIECKGTFDIKDYFAKKGITDTSAYCKSVLKSATCTSITPNESKTCDRANHLAHKTKRLLKKVSDKLNQEPCADVIDKEKGVDEKIDKIIDILNKKRGQKPDPGTYPNPAESCKAILSDLTKPEGEYWIWDNGRAVKKFCKRGDLGTRTNPADDCAQLLVEEGKNEGKYWILVSGKPVEVECKKGDKGTKTNPGLSCTELLVELKKPPNQMYYVFEGGKSVLKKCTKGERGKKSTNPGESCTELLGKLGYPPSDYYLLINGKSVKTHCDKGDPGTSTNPGESCADLLVNHKKNEGKYFIRDKQTGDLVEKECKKGKLGEKTNPAASCDDVFKDDPNNKDGKYWIKIGKEFKQSDCKKIVKKVTKDSIKADIQKIGNVNKEAVGTIFAYDTTGELDAKGSYKFTATIKPVSPSNCNPISSIIKNNNDGTYKLTFTPICKGKYTIQIALNGNVNSILHNFEAKNIDYSNLEYKQTADLADIHCIPFYITIAPSGDIIVSCASKKVIVCDSEGKRKKEIDETFENPGVSAVLKDRIYIPDYSKKSRIIKVFDLNYNAQPKEHINLFISPSVVAANTIENVLYIGEYYTKSLYRYDPVSHTSSTLNIKPNVNPEGLAFDYNGQLHVSGYGEKFIQCYNLRKGESASTEHEYGKGSLRTPKGLAIDKAGNTIVADFYFVSKVKMFDSNYQKMPKEIDVKKSSDVAIGIDDSIWIASRKGLKQYTL